MRASALHREDSLDSKLVQFPTDAHTVDEAQLNDYLIDDRIGPFTGVSMRWVDTGIDIDNPKLGIPSQIYASAPDGTPYFPNPTDRAKLEYTALGIRIARGETEQAMQLCDDPRNPLKRNVITHLSYMLGSGNGGKHRFNILADQYSDLRERTQTLEKILHTNIPVMEAQLRHEPDPQGQLEHDELLYKTLRELFGISLAKGNIDKSMQYVEMLEEFPDRTRFERTWHTTAVINYLRNGGEETLRYAAKKNKVADMIGTKTREGKLGNVKGDLLRGSAIEAVSTVVGGWILANTVLPAMGKGLAYAGMGVVSSDYSLMALALTNQEMNRPRVSAVMRSADHYAHKAAPKLYRGTITAFHKTADAIGSAYEGVKFTIEMMREGYASWLQQRDMYRARQ